MLPVFSAYATDNAQTQDTQEALSVLEYTGAYTVPDSGFPSTQKISRAAFAVITAKAFRLNEGSTNVYFGDVTRERSDIYEINALCEAGIVSAETRSFRPDDDITVSEAVKIMISAAGYDAAAQSMGGYPNGYMRLASDLDIVEYSDSESLTYAEAVNLVYNTLCVNAMHVSGFAKDGENLKYEKDSERIIEKLWDIYLEKGTLEACFTASLSDKTVGKGEVVISGVQYICSDGIEAEDYLAEGVDYVYADDDADPVLIYLAPSKNNKRHLDISSIDIEEFNVADYTLRYLNRGASKTANIARNAKVYLNGSLYTDSLSAVIDDFTARRKHGNIKLIDSGLGKYDIVIINSARNIVSAQTSDDGETLYNMANANDNIDLGAYTNIDIRTEKGSETTLQITSPTVLSVSESVDKRFLKIVVCKETVSGKIIGIENDGDEDIVTIGEKTALLDAGYASVFIKLQQGSSYTVYLDNFGYIAYAETILAGSLVPGLMLDFKVNRDEDEKSYIKIFTKDETVEKYQLAEKLKMDGKSYSRRTSAIDIAANMPETDGIVTRNGSIDYDASAPAVKIQVIRYQLDDDGKIKEIDTINVGDNEDKKSSLSEIDNTYKYSKMRVRWTSGTMRFGSAILYNSSATVIFGKPLTNSLGQLVDDDGNVLMKDGEPAVMSDDMYTTKITPVDNEQYNVSGYKYTPDSMYADVILMEYAAAALETKTFVYSTQTQELNDDDEVITVAKLWDGATLKKYELTDKDLFAGINRGDLVRCMVGEKDGKVYGTVKIYDSARDVFVNNGLERVDSTSVSGDNVTFSPGFWWTGSIVTSQTTGMAQDQLPYVKFQAEKGRAVDKIGNALFWDWDGDYNTYEECLDTRGTVPILIIDRKNITSKDAVYKGTVADIPTYKQSGSNAAQIVYVTSWWVPQCIYVYVN